MRSRRAQGCASPAHGCPWCCAKRGLPLATASPHAERSPGRRRGGPGGPAPEVAQSSGRGGQHRAALWGRVRSPDPSGPGAYLDLAHVWAKKRADLRIPAPGQRASVAMLGLLDWGRRKLIVRTSRTKPSRTKPSRTKRSSDFVAVLEEVDRRYGPKLGVAIKPIVLVLDNGPIHTSKMSRAALAERAHWLTVEWLPKY